jgi:hypothetical protein
MGHKSESSSKGGRHHKSHKERSLEDRSHKDRSQKDRSQKDRSQKDRSDKEQREQTQTGTTMVETWSCVRSPHRPCHLNRDTNAKQDECRGSAYMSTRYVSSCVNCDHRRCSYCPVDRVWETDVNVIFRVRWPAMSYLNRTGRNLR